MEETNFVKRNLSNIICLIVGALIGVAIMFAMWPSRIASLKDGTEPVAEIKGHTFTADDLYAKYKEETGIGTLISIVDDYILHDKYDIEKEAEEFSKTQSETIYESYKNYYGFSKEEFLANNNFATEAKFLEYLKNEYYYQHYYDEYVSGTITDKELNEYYDKYVFGKKHIYLFMAEKKEDLDKLAKELKTNTDYAKLTEAYPNVTGQDIKEITFNGEGNYSQSVLETVASTSKGNASKVFEDSNSKASTLIYVVDEEEKPKLDKVNEDVKKALVTKKQGEDEKLYYQAFIALRKEYNLDFKDTSLGKAYEELEKQYK